MLPMVTEYLIQGYFINEGVCRMIQAATGTYDEPAVRPHLNVFWHSIAKMILQGTVKGQRRKGRQRK